LDPLLEDFLGFSEDPAEELPPAAAAAEEDAGPESCVTGQNVRAAGGQERCRWDEKRFPQTVDG